MRWAARQGREFSAEGTIRANPLAGVFGDGWRPRHQAGGWQDPDHSDEPADVGL